MFQLVSGFKTDICIFSVLAYLLYLYISLFLAWFLGPRFLHSRLQSTGDGPSMEGEDSERHAHRERHPFHSAHTKCTGVCKSLPNVLPVILPGNLPVIWFSVSLQFYLYFTCVFTPVKTLILLMILPGILLIIRLQNYLFLHPLLLCNLPV